jgi:hypothetical protein
MEARVAWVVRVGLLLASMWPAAAQGEPERWAWVGIERGPLSPAEVNDLERAMMASLPDSVLLYDPAGHALGERTLAHDAARVSKLVDEGIDLGLKLQHKPALEKLDQAITTFESRLLALRDYEILEEALTAKAEAHFQAGERQAAKTALQRLAALSPRRVPNADTHPPKFVALWMEASAGLGRPGVLAIEAPGAMIQVDGKELGPAPIDTPPLPAGRHYIVARWPDAQASSPVNATEGKRVGVKLGRDAPAYARRKELFEAVVARAGAQAIDEVARQIAKAAGTDGVAFVTARASPDSSVWLYGATHDTKGRRRNAGKVALSTHGAAVLLAGALFSAPAIREFAIQRGKPEPAKGVAAAIYGAVGDTELSDGVRSEAELARESGELPKIGAKPAPAGAEVLDSTPGEAAAHASTTAPPPDDGIITKWWFWTILGVVAVGGVAGAMIAFRRPDPKTTQISFTLPGN